MIFFETIKCKNFKIFDVEYHIKRIRDTVGRDFPLSEYIYPPNDKLLKCNVIYNKNQILDVSFKEYKKRVLKSFKLVKSNIRYDKKYLNRDALNRLFLQKNGCDDILIFNDNNLLKDTSIANIALMIDNTWFTPKKPLLYGTKREKLLKQKIIVEKDLFVKDLKKADKFAIFNAMNDFVIIEKVRINYENTRDI